MVPHAGNTACRMTWRGQALYKANKNTSPYFCPCPVCYMARAFSGHCSLQQLALCCELTSDAGLAALSGLHFLEDLTLCEGPAISAQRLVGVMQRLPRLKVRGAEGLWKKGWRIETYRRTPGLASCLPQAHLRCWPGRIVWVTLLRRSHTVHTPCKGPAVSAQRLVGVIQRLPRLKVRGDEDLWWQGWKGWHFETDRRTPGLASC
jgi:hypothetical protein